MKTVLTLSLMTFLMCIFGSAWAGNEMGNGGDGYAQEFVALGRQLVVQLKREPDPSIADISTLERAVNETRVITEDALELEGAPVDALNFPNKAEIKLSRSRWANYDSKQKAALVLHEYLGVSRVADDHNYQISGSYTEMNLKSESKPIGIELEIHSGYSTNLNAAVAYRPTLGGDFGYRLSRNSLIFVGIDSYRFKEGDTTDFYYFTEKLMKYSMGYRYSAIISDRWRPFAEASFNYVDDTTTMWFGEGGLTADVLSRNQFGYGGAMGIAYAIARGWSANLGMAVTGFLAFSSSSHVSRHPLGDAHLGLAYNF